MRSLAMGEPGWEPLPPIDAGETDRACPGWRCRRETEEEQPTEKVPSEDPGEECGPGTEPSPLSRQPA